MMKKFVLVFLFFPGLLQAQIKKRAAIPSSLPIALANADAKYPSVMLLKNDDKKVIELANQYTAIIDKYGKNTKTLNAVRKLASIEANKLNHPDIAINLLESMLNIPGIDDTILAETKLELGDHYVINNQPWDAILLYGQVDKAYENQNMGNDAKYRSARLSFYQGNFDYAKAQVDLIKASTSQLIANDALNLSLLISDHLKSPSDTLTLKLFAAAELAQLRNNSVSALAKLDSISILYPEHTLKPDILMAKSRIYRKNSEFQQTEALLKELIAQPEQSIWTDDAIFMLAGLYENQLQQPEKAKELYQKLITDFQGSMFIPEARSHFRRLRGDNIDS